VIAESVIDGRARNHTDHNPNANQHTTADQNPTANQNATADQHPTTDQNSCRSEPHCRSKLLPHCGSKLHGRSKLPVIMSSISFQQPPLVIIIQTHQAVGLLTRRLPQQPCAAVAITVSNTRLHELNTQPQTDWRRAQSTQRIVQLRARTQLMGAMGNVQ
jgi:hypothetical protein